MADDECHERVVLVSVRGGGGAAKPKRKVAIALPPENDYALFAERVRKKLNLQGVAGIFHAESNIQVRDLSELQDIDDLVVDEGEASAATIAGSSQMIGNGNPPASPSHGSLSATSSRKPRTSTFASEQHIDVEAGDDGEDKYARKGNPMYRMLVPFAPEGLLRSNSGAASLPVTTKDIDGSKGQRRRRNNPLDPRKLLLVFALVSCVATMILLYSRIAADSVPLDGMLVPGEHDHLVKSETLTLGVGGQ